METRWAKPVCIIRIATKLYHLVKVITVNCYRSGATNQTYMVPNSDNSAAGDYTCIVTVSTVASSESSSYGTKCDRYSDRLKPNKHAV